MPIVMASLRNKIDFLDLPLDILINILNKLDFSDLRNLMLSCQTLRHLILNNNGVWRFLAQKHFTIQVSININRKVSLYHQFRLSHNWHKGFFRDKVIINKKINYMPWLRLWYQNLIISFGSELYCYHLDKKGIPDRQVTWKLVVPKKTNVGVRTNDISRFLIKNSYIVCGNRDGCISVYNVKDIKVQPKLDYYIENCHNYGNNEVSAVEVTTKYCQPCVISASNDNHVVKFWDLEKNTSNYVKPNYSRFNRNQQKQVQSKRDIPIEQCVGIRCISLDDNESKLALGLNGNSKPFLLDVETGNSLLNNEYSLNIREVVRDIQWHDGNTIAFVTHSGLLQLVDVRSSETVFKAMDPFGCTLYCVRTDGCRAMIVGSSQYSRCVLYDCRCSSKHVQMYFTQRQASPIYSLDFDLWKLIAAADRSVATLDFNVNVAATAQRDNSFTFEHLALS